MANEKTDAEILNSIAFELGHARATVAAVVLLMDTPKYIPPPRMLWRWLKYVERRLDSVADVITGGGQDE